MYLAAVASVEVADAWGNTPLWRAVFSAQGSLAIAHRLVAARAIPTARTSAASLRVLSQSGGVSDPYDYFDPNRG